MNEGNTFKNQVIICHCSGTTEETIKALVLNNIFDFEEISRKTGVCSGCGSCEDLVLDLIMMARSHSTN